MDEFSQWLSEHEGFVTSLFFMAVVMTILLSIIIGTAKSLRAQKKEENRIKNIRDGKEETKKH